MVKGRRKSRSKSSGDFCAVDNTDESDEVGLWRRTSIPGEGIYEGSMKNGLRDGQGRQKDPRGGSYVGSWIEGLQSGFGIKSYKSGDRHEGNYSEGKRSGSGIYMWRNGDVYTGDWSNGLIDGKGSFTWASGDKYIGAWFKGEMHGEGVKSQMDGSVLEGTFFRGKAHGSAKKVFSQGDVYKGNYVMDCREGYGEYYWVDGSIYRGSWVRDKITGHGEKFSRVPSTPAERYRIDFLGIPDSIIAYRGQFLDGKRIGKGTAVMSNKCRYIGDWADDVMSGWGRLEDPCGAYYEGEFEGGLKHGMGVLVFPPTKRPTNSVEQVGSDDDADDDDEDRDSIEFMLNNTVSKIQAVNQENEDGHDEEDSQHSVFNYALNESVIVEHILDSCRNFKRFGHTDLLTKSENKVGFYDFENCCTYRGNFFNDKPQGIGIIELRNGQVFFGHFIRGVKVDNKFH